MKRLLLNSAASNAWPSSRSVDTDPNLLFFISCRVRSIFIEKLHPFFYIVLHLMQTNNTTNVHGLQPLRCFLMLPHLLPSYRNTRSWTRTPTWCRSPAALRAAHAAVRPHPTTSWSEWPPTSRSTNARTSTPSRPASKPSTTSLPRRKTVMSRSKTITFVGIQGQLNEPHCVLCVPEKYNLVADAKNVHRNCSC